MNEKTEKPKKILYSITKSNFGGAQRYVLDIAKAMKEFGFEVAVALGALPAHAGQAGEGVLKQKLNASHIRTFSIDSLARDISIAKDTASLSTLYRIIKQEHPDILHLNSPKAAGLGAFVGRILGIKRIIYTVHGWTFNEHRPWWQKTVIIFFSWLTMLLCHKVILLSKKEFLQASRFPFVKNKLTLIPLGIQPPMFLEREEARQKLSEKILLSLSERTVIGTVAELHPNKNLNSLIDVLAEILKNNSNAMGIIVGEGQERNVLEEKIKEKGLEQKVYLTGYLDDASTYLKAFDVFVLPSLKEGLPYVLLEAGLASLPVVATEVGGIPSIIENKKTGLVVQPKNPAELEKALSFMIEHPKERTAFGSALNAHITSKFSFNTLCSETKRCYQEKSRGVANHG